MTAAVWKNCRIPETVQKIGAYACYNCREMEEINIPRETTDLGTGLFLNCDKLTSISFGRCRHIADLVAVLNHELHLTMDFDDGNRAKLLIPDFQYEYIEDTPARQFHQVNYGTGHLFRQCIGNSDIDFRRFDELFYLTKREDGALMVLLLSHVPSGISLPLTGKPQTGLSAISERAFFHCLWVLYPARQSGQNPPLCPVGADYSGKHRFSAGNGRRSQKNGNHGLFAGIPACPFCKKEKII